MKFRHILTVGLMGLISAVSATAADIDVNLCDAKATKDARDVYTWLRTEVWGKKTIAGAHSLYDYNTTEADRYRDLAGNYVKMNIYDFQHFFLNSPDYTGNSAKDWQQKGGIVGFMWHWQIFRNPFFSAEASARGYGSSTGDAPTHITPKYATVKGTLENRILMEDLVKIKDLLLQYQSQGITVVWRPFHEGAGNAGNLEEGAWFWWGADGPVHYRRLWNYVQDYLWENGVHNLIYVWTSQTNDVRWYPGDDRVDIVARDNYAKDNQGSKKADFDILRKFWPNKMTALGECGSIPDPDDMVKDGAMWLYVAPWCDKDYVSQDGSATQYGNDKDFMTKWLSHPAVITR